MTNVKIENLQELISQYVGPKKKILEQKLTNLTAPGENYGSAMMKLDLVLKDQATSQEEDLHTVAKCVLVNDDTQDDFQKKMSFQQFRNEMVFYTEMLPTLKEFQKRQGMLETDIFPELYAARSNLHGNDTEVDENAVLILENLIQEGYRNADRHVGFDLQETKLILKGLAEFHAIPLALKIKKPYVFQQKIKDNIQKPEFPPDGPGGPGGPDGPSLPNGHEGPGGPGGPGGPEGPHGFFGPYQFFELLEKYDSCKPYLSNLKKKFDSGKLGHFDNQSKEGPFHTLHHSDMWVNNTMQRYENGKPLHNKLVDFQMYGYDTPTRDLLFFLFSSVQLSVLKTHLDELIKHYHSHFVKVLEDLKCDTNPFNYYKFLVEIDSTAIDSFSQIMTMSIIIFGKKNESALAMDNGKLQIARPTEIAIKKVAYAVEEFGKRGWFGN